MKSERELTRRAFARLLAAGLAASPALLAGAGFDHLRGDRVGWARLKTPSQHWKRHAGSDKILTTFFRDQTTLNIDPVWYVADADDLSQLSQYPFLFSQGVANIVSTQGKKNLAEYIRRGGFVLVDACHDSRVTPDFDAFLSEQIAFYALTLPQARVVSLPNTHEIYTCHFKIPNGKPMHTFMANVFDENKARHGLYGVMLGSRMVGVISLCGWQCGWDHVTEYAYTYPEGTDVACMQMVVNIYVYAMTQGV
jgi:hypothetical protein